MGVKNKNIEDFYPLSPMQQGIFFHSVATPESGVYFEQLSWTLQGNLNIAAFQQAWQHIVERHSILRTCFVWKGLKEPAQVVHRQVTLPWVLHDCQHLSLVEQQQHLQAFLKSDRSQGFELTRPPLMRLILHHLAENYYNFTWSHHHLLIDGWSNAIIIKEVLDCYKAFSNDQDIYLEPIRSYRDYIVWLQQQNLSQAEAFWRQLLKGFTAPTQIWVGKGSGQLPTSKDGNNQEDIKLSRETTAALQFLAQQHQLTLNTLVQAAWGLLLSRYSGQEDVVFGAITSGRPPGLAKSEFMVGVFINTLPVRVQASPTEFLLPWLKQIQTQQVETRQYEYSPLVEIQGWSEVPRSLPLFESIVVFENFPVDASLHKLDVNFKIESFSSFHKTNYPITLVIIPGEELWLKITHNDSERFETNNINRMLGHLKTLLEAILVNPQSRLSELSLLSQSEKALLVEWNDTKIEYPQHQCIHQLFEVQVERSPDAIAVVFEDQQLTYGELNQRANQLAHHLRSLGVKPEVLVGICVQRSLDMVIGLLGILKAGGAYVPFDSGYPKERLAFMLENSQPSVLLTQQHLVDNLPTHRANVVCIDSTWELIAQQRIENPRSNITADNLAYVIYTSGSTGRPKGAMNTHRGICNRLLWMQDAYQLTATDKVLQKTPFSFDVSVWEFFWPLITGAGLVVAQPEGHKDTNYLVNLITQQQISTLHFVPSMLQVFLEAENLETCKCLKRVIVSGEALPGELQNRFFKRLNAELHNLYGPTEAAVDVTFWECVHQSSSEQNSVIHQKTVPIGRPIANIQIYLLDQYINPVPVGVTGEVYIGGVGVGRGYFNRAELTAEKFIPNPFSNKTAARLYKTGDLARYLPNGEIEYIGRIDNQVKIRGFRIELGEIEAVISQHPAVRETVVVAHSDSADSQRIVAYVVPDSKEKLTITELRHFLESKLPNYMIPAAFVMLETLPLTPNGKVDRKALSAPELTQLFSESDFIPPTTAIEEILAGIWAQILSLEKVGIHNNFFELGGHSLLATQVISQIRKVFQQELSLGRLFEQPTIAGLAKDIEQATKADLGLETATIERISRSQQLPLSFAQQRLWFLAQFEPNSPFYNIPAAVRLQGKLNLGGLQQSFNEILRRHEALRTNFQTVEGQAIAVLSSVTSLLLPVFDISELPSNQQEAEIRQLVDFEAQQPFDLNSDLLLRVKLLRLDELEHILLLTMHHIASDGWSVGVLVREVATLYQTYCDQQPSTLAELPIQYVDFAAWQRQWLQAEVLQLQISYWKKQLEGAPAILELPTDHPRPAVITFQGASYSFELSVELSQALNKLSQQQGSTLFMTLLAAFQTLLWRYTGNEDIVVGSPIANRNRQEIEGLIGFFVNTLVLRTNLAGNPTFRELLTRVREVALGAYAHQDFPFEQLVEQLQPQRDLSYTPLFQVMFVLQNAPMSALELPGLTLSPLESESRTAKFDLTLYMTETAEGLVGTLEYNTDLFEKNTISRMAGHLQTLLEGIAANPQQHLKDLPLLTQVEQVLLAEWNHTEVEYPQEKCIHQLFEAQVEQTPDAIAVVFEDEQLSYRELNTRANQLAHYLRSLGVKSEVLVGICTERSPSMIIGLLGILKAGGAYVPLDPAYPPSRLAFMLSDSQVPVLLTQQQLGEKLPEHQAQVVCLDTDWNIIAQQSQDNPASISEVENLAYVIYTSGSTGQPKGVFGLHRGAVNRFHWMWQNYPFVKGEVCCQKTSLNFVDSVWEIFGSLLQGVTTVIVPDEVVKDPQQFITTLAHNNVTRLVLVPSLLRILLNTSSILQLQLPQLKLWISSGETLSIDLLGQFRQSLPDSTLLNLYGSSEVSGDVSCYSLSPQASLPECVLIGRAIANTQIYVLDGNKQPVPIGVLGELYIGGDGLARGYLNQPELTAEKFISNPFSNKLATRLYKTGDLARYLPNGEIEYIGRIDHQVKIRGFRIELPEIEARLTQHLSIREAVVVVREDVSGDKWLVAYVVCEHELVPTLSELRSFLKENLPDYMVPTAFVPMKALPLTPNGKVNRQALPVPDNLRPQLEATYIKPQTDLEKAIAAVWQKALKLEKVGIHDNFFELGGHSLLIVQVHNQLRQICSENLSMIEMFRYPTISSLAEFLNQKNTNYQTDTRTEQLKDGKSRIKQFLAISKKAK